MACEIIQDLEKCTSDAPSTSKYGNVITITITADSGCVFETAPMTDSYQNSRGSWIETTFTLSNNNTLAVATIDVGSDIYITATAVSQVKGLSVEQSLTNCKSNIGATIEFNTEFSTIVTADSGCVFKEEPYYSWRDTKGSYHNVTLELSNNDTVAMCTFVSPSEQEYESGFNLYANAKVDVPYINKYGSINVYNVTNEELESFSKQRYFVSSDGGVTKYDDLGQFIVKLHRVYCEIGDTTPALIQAAYQDTSVQSRTPLNDIVIVDFGSIQVPEPNNDIVDYDSEISLFLPFKGFVTLNTPELLGKHIRLIYIVNIVSGDCVANIEVDNIVVHSETLKLITEVFFRTYDTPSYFSVDYNVNALSGFIPYLVIKHYNSKMVQLYNNNERGCIGEFAGYHEFTNIVNIDALNATNEEIDLIINNLQKGIIL